MYLLNEIRALLWPSAKGIYLTPEIVNSAKIFVEKEHIDKLNEFEIEGYNTIDFIDSDNASEHIYYDIQLIEGEKLD